VVRPGRHPNRRGAQAGHSLSWQGARRQNTGDLWRVKLESNDCDFHLEISTPGQLKTANRIIVELPQGPLFLATRQKLIDELIANGYDPAVDKPLDLDEPLRIKVIGLPFYDSAHYSKKNPKRGHGHGTAKVGTLWELHPFGTSNSSNSPSLPARILGTLSHRFRTGRKGPLS